MHYRQKGHHIRSSLIGALHSLIAKGAITFSSLPREPSCSCHHQKGHYIHIITKKAIIFILLPKKAITSHCQGGNFHLIAERAIAYTSCQEGHHMLKSLRGPSSNVIAKRDISHLIAKRAISLHHCQEDHSIHHICKRDVIIHCQERHHLHL